MTVRLDSTTLSADAMMEAAESLTFALSISMRPGCNKKKMNASNGPSRSDKPATLFTDNVPMVSRPI